MVCDYKEKCTIKDWDGKNIRLESVEEIKAHLKDSLKFWGWSVNNPDISGYDFEKDIKWRIDNINLLRKIVEDIINERDIKELKGNLLKLFSTKKSERIIWSSIGCNRIINYIRNGGEGELILLRDILKKMYYVDEFDNKWIDDLYQSMIKQNPKFKKVRDLEGSLLNVFGEIFGKLHINYHPIYNGNSKKFIKNYFKFKFLSYDEFEECFNKVKEVYNEVVNISSDLDIEKNIEIDTMFNFFYHKADKENEEDWKKLVEKWRKIGGDGFPPPPLLDPELEKALDEILYRERQVILYGPVGTGKTWTAMKYVEKKGGKVEFVTFHQSYGYEEFIEGLKPVVDDKGHINYIVEDGIFKRIVLKAVLIAMEKKDMLNEKYKKLLRYLEDQEKMNYREYMEIKKELWNDILNKSDVFNNAPKVYMIIDEINRGNISRIFGELITALEKDKRLDSKNKVLLTLPYSKEKFGIPPNLYIIGTMNTSDRSITLLDIALRRRFGFYELQPNYKALENNLKDVVGSIEIDGINIVEFLKNLNRLIAALRDKDHQIGQAYFFDVKNIDDFRYVWYYKIIPLLEEFFYNDTEILNTLLKPFIEQDLNAKNIMDGLNLEGDSTKAYKIKYLEKENFIEKIKGLWVGKNN